MGFSFFAQFQSEKPYQIGSDVLVSHYIKQNKIKSIEAFQNRLTIHFEGGGIIEMESNSNVTVTYRTVIGRMR